MRLVTDDKMEVTASNSKILLLRKWEHVLLRNHGSNRSLVDSFGFGFEIQNKSRTPTYDDPRIGLVLAHTARVREGELDQDEF